jgi:hypothetical protein
MRTEVGVGATYEATCAAVQAALLVSMPTWEFFRRWCKMWRKVRVSNRHCTSHPGAVQELRL